MLVNFRGVRLVIALFALSATMTTVITAPAVAQKAKKDDPAAASAPMAPPYTGPKKLAVMNTDQQGNTAASSDAMKAFKAGSGINNADDVGLKLNSMLTTALQDTGRFVLVERQNLDDIRGEQALTAEGQTTKQTGAQKGGILGAQQMVRCTITEFSDESEKDGSSGGINLGGIRVGGGSARKKAKVTVDIKIYDVGTSRILYTDSRSGTSESKGSATSVVIFGASATFGKSTNDPIEKATRNAIASAVDFIVQKMEDIPWEGKIALVDKDDDGKAFYALNRGESDGIKVGDKLVVTKPGKDIIDPDTGEKIGCSKDTILGGCTVSWTGKNVAHVDPDTGVTISQGNVLKLK